MSETSGPTPAGRDDVWPSLPLEAWEDTYATLHRWVQIIGKIRLKLAPMVNHWWQVPLYVTSRGLTTSPMPYGAHLCQIDLDFLSHEMRLTTDTGRVRPVPLLPRSVADFYAETMSALSSLGVEASIWTTPVEIPERTPFEQDRTHAAYDAEYAWRLWRVLVQTDRLLHEFRSRFIGKVSPVHFFWGAFDMACTRFSGRRAPRHPGAPYVARFVAVEAYSHEVASCGFWPGAGLGEPAFYAYAYPEPEGYRDWPVRPPGAYYQPELREFILPYEALRGAPSPETALLDFAQSTYEAAAELAGWDRGSLERGADKTSETGGERGGR